MTKSMQEIIQEAYNQIPQINPEEALAWEMMELSLSIPEKVMK